MGGVVKINRDEACHRAGARQMATITAVLTATNLGSIHMPTSELCTLSWPQPAVVKTARMPVRGCPPLPGGPRGKSSVVQPTGPIVFSTLTCQTRPGSGTCCPGNTCTAPALEEKLCPRAWASPCPACPGRWTGPAARPAPMPTYPMAEYSVPQMGASVQRGGCHEGFCRPAYQRRLSPRT